jgi:hypothetical protein
MLTTANTTIAVVIDKPPRPKRRMLVSLRLFVGMLILFGGSGVLWIGTRAYRQHSLIEDVEKVGGYILLEPVGPRWLRVRVGEQGMRSFDKAVWIRLNNTDATDDTLRYISSQVGLQRLYLANTRVTDRTLARISHLTDLEDLNLKGTLVTDAGLEHLRPLIQLRDIDLSKTAVTDAGLANLSGLTKVERLALHNTAITDEGLAELGDLPDLNYVILGPEMTDESLEYLALWPNLRTVWLIRTAVTADGVKRLKAVLPKCAVNY